MSLLEVKNLSIAYAGCEPAVQKLSFSVESGASVGIVGESGAGKSQTALALMGLLPRNAMTGGSIRIGGTEVVGANVKTLRALRTRRISMVFQDPLAAFNPYLRIGEQLRLIVDQHEIGKRRERRKRCLEMLERVGLRDPERQYRSYPHQLSGGMRQRALIAAALIGEASLLVADEPTTALDVTVQAQILELLGRLRADLGTAILLITHDLGVIANTCEHLIVMDNGRLVEQGDCRELLSNPQQAHTARLVAAVPDLAAAPEHRAKKTGWRPDPSRREPVRALRPSAPGTQTGIAGGRRRRF